MMPELAETTLVSAAKLAEAGYVSILTTMKSMCTIHTIPRSRYHEARYLEDTSAPRQDYGASLSPKTQ